MIFVLLNVCLFLFLDMFVCSYNHCWLSILSCVTSTISHTIHVISGGCKLSNKSSTWTSIRRVICSLSSMSFKNLRFLTVSRKKVFAMFVCVKCAQNQKLLIVISTKLFIDKHGFIYNCIINYFSEQPFTYILLIISIYLHYDQFG